jgi:sugar-phosphatase
MRRRECSAILFDLDGVLVDSTALVETQWRRWAAARGLRAEPFLRVCHGRRAVETVRLAAPDLDAEAEVRALVPLADDVPPGPCDGAARLLRLLPEGSWGVATSSPREPATERLLRAGLPVPRVLVCAEDVTRGKPSPEVYLAASAALRVPAHGCLVIEDAPPGIEAARAAGMAVVGLTTTHRPDQLSADLRTASLANVHLGRFERDAAGRWKLEVLIIEQ